MSNILTPVKATVKVAKAAGVNWTRNAKALAALAEFKALKAIEAAGKVAEKRRKSEVEPVMWEAIGSESQAIVRGLVAVKVIESSNTSTDLKALAEAFPEAYAACVKTTPVRYFKVL